MSGVCLLVPVSFRRDKRNTGPSQGWALQTLEGEPLDPPAGLWADQEGARAEARRRRLRIVNPAQEAAASATRRIA